MKQKKNDVLIEKMEEIERLRCELFELKKLRLEWLNM